MKAYESNQHPSVSHNLWLIYKFEEVYALSSSYITDISFVITIIVITNKNIPK